MGYLVSELSSYTGFTDGAGGTGRKIFYAAGRYWVFYSDGTNLVWRTSTNGINWSGASTVTACSYGSDWSVCFDGTYVHYARAHSTAAPAIVYRRGTPGPDGTISWSAVEQTALAGVAGVAIDLPNVAVDSGGYPWIGYERIPGLMYPCITTVDTAAWDASPGTWTTAANFPYQLSTSIHQTVEPVPLTGGKLLAIYATHGGTIKSKAWDGAAWSAEATTTEDSEYRMLSAVADGDDVHLVFLEDDNLDILHSLYDYTGNAWAAETTVQAAVTNKSSPTLCSDYSGGLYCFWIGSPIADHIYYKRYKTGAWDTGPTDWIDESANGFYVNTLLRTFYERYSNQIGLAYIVEASYPNHELKFDWLTPSCDWNSPGTTATADRDGKAAWANPNNAQATDDARAICDVAKLDYGDWLRCTNLSFVTGDVPSGATVVGVEIKIERQGEGDTLLHPHGLFLRDSGGQAGDDGGDVSIAWSDADVKYIHGGPADAWGAGLSDSEVRASTFGVDISCSNTDLAEAREARIDHVQARIYYTPAGGANIPVLSHIRRLMGD